jgi:hypothetical protein
MTGLYEQTAGQGHNRPPLEDKEDQNSRPGIDSAAWHGSTRPAGVTLRERRPQPPTQGLGKRA